jgi:hypothetical protein
VRLQIRAQGMSLHVKILKAQGRKPCELVINIDSQRLYTGSHP